MERIRNGEGRATKSPDDRNICDTLHLRSELCNLPRLRFTDRASPKSHAKKGVKQGESVTHSTSGKQYRLGIKSLANLTPAELTYIQGHEATLPQSACKRRTCNCHPCLKDTGRARRRARNPGVCTARDCSCASCSVPIYIGLDMGERYALGATAFHRPSGMIRKTKVRMRALYRYSTDKKAKYEAMRNSSPYQVQESENEMSHVMAKRGFQLSTDEGGVPSKDPLQHMSDFTEALTRLSHFHSSRKVLDLHWQAKRARKSEFDRAVHQILVMVGGASHLQAGRQKVIFGFGDAKVGGWCGPFMDYLVLKLKSLGYKHIYYVDESYTSQYCPRCGSTASLVPNSKVRIKECDECGVYFHRDEMAGHNIANTLEFYTLHGRRPDYLPSSRRN